jgi:hypothetical protein
VNGWAAIFDRTFAPRAHLEGLCRGGTYAIKNFKNA